MFTVVEITKQAALLIKKELRNELKEQGHKATGSLIASIENRLKISTNATEVEIWFEDYGEYLNKGRKANNRKKVPISALIRWMRVKGFQAQGDKKERSIAFAIQASIHKHGSPTPGSLRFSKTGKRKGFIEEVDKRVDPAIDLLIDKASQKQLEKALDLVFA